MKSASAILDVEIRDLPPLRVAHRYCLFRSKTENFDKTIRKAFRELRERVAEFGLDPDTLLHVGIPEIEDDELISYDCCIEFPIPEGGKTVKELPGGRYAVLTVEKTSAKIVPAIRQFCGDYLPDHGLIPDEDHPTYEIYYKDIMEYCVPIR